MWKGSPVGEVKLNYVLLTTEGKFWVETWNGTVRQRRFPCRWSCGITINCSYDQLGQHSEATVFLSRFFFFKQAYGGKFGSFANSIGSRQVASTGPSFVGSVPDFR